MSVEKTIPQCDQSIYEAIYNHQVNKKVVVKLNDFHITFGLPNLVKTTKRPSLSIPYTPHVFNVKLLSFLKKEKNHIYSTTLTDQIILFCHGKKQDDRKGKWKFVDGQSPFKLVKIINDLAPTVPKINAIIACQPMATEDSDNFLEGYAQIPGVILQKAGKVYVIGIKINNNFRLVVLSEVSDFYQVSYDQQSFIPLPIKYSRILSSNN